MGCPSSSVTVIPYPNLIYLFHDLTLTLKLRNGVENMLMHYIPEVKGIEEVLNEKDSDESPLKLSPTTWKTLINNKKQRSYDS